MLTNYLINCKISNVYSAKGANQLAKKRVLLKISGETFGKPYDREGPAFIAEEIKFISDTHEPVIVTGGGNIVRGSQLKKEFFRRNTMTADWMGMMAVVMNAIALQDFLENEYGLDTRVMSALEVNKVCEPYYYKKAISHLRKGRIVILAGGIGTPNFSTDTTMIVRASELGIKLALKGTKVDGIYTKDPKKHPDAKLIRRLSYMGYLKRRLGVVDAAAVVQAMDLGVEIKIFNFFERGNLKRVLTDGNIGSVIR